MQKESVAVHVCIQIHKAGGISDLHYVSFSFCRQTVINSLFLLLLPDLESDLLVLSL